VAVLAGPAHERAAADPGPQGRRPVTPALLTGAVADGDGRQAGP
jgi:hypothetical protein